MLKNSWGITWQEWGTGPAGMDNPNIFCVDEIPADFVSEPRKAFPFTKLWIQAQNINGKYGDILPGSKYLWKGIHLEKS